MKKLILDCGGVLVWPRLGDWNLPYGAAAILGERRAKDLHTGRYLLAHRQCAAWLDEAQLVKDVAAERALRREYVRAMDAAMGWRLTAAEIDALADDFTDNIRRYGFYEDAKVWLPRWRKRFALGILSDAMPSILPFMEQEGLLQYFDAAVISTQVGAIKPDARMYAAILEKLDADPADCLFVDDRPCNLEGAVKAGMRAVQMARSNALPEALWDGPVVRNFAGLNRFMEREEIKP